MKLIMENWKQFLKEGEAGYGAKLGQLLNSGDMLSALDLAEVLGIDLYTEAHDALIGAVQKEIEQVVEQYDQPPRYREVVYFAPEQNYHGDINEYWDIREDQNDEYAFSVWIVSGGKTFEIRDGWGKTAMMTHSWEDIPGMVNEYMSQRY